MERRSHPVTSPVGTSVPRVDGVAKVTGRARYLDDLEAHGAWHGATVRSSVPHGVLEALDRDPAFDWSQVVVATAADIAKLGGRHGHAPGKNAIFLIDETQLALVPIGGRVMHVDEPLAVIAAPTKALAYAAVKAMRPRIA